MNKEEQNRVKEIEAKEEYSRWRVEYDNAKTGLQGAIKRLHKLGIHPPPIEGLRFGLPDERKGIVHKFSVGEGENRIKLYVKTGTYDDGSLGELFLRADRQGSFVSALMDSFATLFSVAIQYGVPLERLINKFRHVRFAPDGFTGNDSVRNCTSIIDYLGQWLELRYVPKELKSPAEPHQEKPSGN